MVAAKVVSDYSQNGFDDWFLPSKDELNELYGKRTEVGGSFSANYWSSTESMSSNAWYNLFAGGGEYGVNKNNPNIRVRAIRSF